MVLYIWNISWQSQHVFMVYIHDDSYVANSTISLDNSTYFSYLYLCLSFLPSNIYTYWQFLSTCYQSKSSRALFFPLIKKFLYFLTWEQSSTEQTQLPQAWDFCSYLLHPSLEICKPYVEIHCPQSPTHLMKSKQFINKVLKESSLWVAQFHLQQQ